MATTSNRFSIPVFSLFLLLGVFSSCFSNKVNVDNHNSLLAKCWTHSYEDNVGDSQTYLPCDAKDFPPSRFRARFTLAEDGTCNYMVLAPNDAHTEASGTWSYDETTKTLLIKDAGGALAHNYVVELLESGKMLLK